ncbi:MAG TPA: hypothetical protein DCX32_03985 [Candidatus Moranbacteria bacterium]|nr:MAG: hypothetical protein UW87_C0013G0013 [Candidatus Moranbacteria bacterium GW2011_GWC2_45_10]KKT94971.1 MAG: hypothetical protein UW95_C0006G0036 [Parcubacteria group bacterium GW2011_GWC1_45_14]HAV11668.1 hypothetical protein [Candidatus Moranbacteria bacterium]
MEQETLGQTKSCPKCGERIQSSAKVCRYCKEDFGNWFARHKIITGVLIFIALLIVISSNDSSEDKVATPVSETSKNNTSTSNSAPVKSDKTAVNSGGDAYSPAPETTTPTEDASEYGKAMSKALITLTKGVGYTQNAAVYGASGNYAEALKEVDNASDNYSLVLAEIKKLKTPDSYKKTQELIVEATDKFNQANNFLKNGLNKKDVGSVNRAIELMTEGTKITEQATEEFNKANNANL